MRVARSRERQGLRTYVLLVVSMGLVIILVTGASLLLIRHQLRKQVVSDFTQDLNRSVVTFQNLQTERLRDLERENALLAELPTLKALMTSGDDITIQNGATEIWRLSGTDLFMLAGPSGRVMAAYAKKAPVNNTLRRGMKALLAAPAKHYLIDSGSLYACAIRPLYFGSDQNGTLLGYVLSGVSIERTIRQISQPTRVEAAFVSNGQIVASTFARDAQANLTKQSVALSGMSREPAEIRLGGIQFLSATEDLSATATSPLQLIVLKSFEPAERSINHTDRMVLIAGLLALLSGTILMIVISRLVTHPLEELSRSVLAFGLGDVKHRVPRHGTREVRHLSAAFTRMRGEIQKANQTVLESERLATIGRMARSVSHDLRHYLAAIFANAEFLASDRFPPRERAEIFGDIRAAVNGTTDMIESLLIFSRTGGGMTRRPELMATLLERAAALVRAHPDASEVMLTTEYGEPADTAVVVDGKRIERAISNLLLNACQSVRATGVSAKVVVTLEAQEHQTTVTVIDNGLGVSEKIRKSLFEPFVSEGKQKGTGLGLTLAHCIAVEHGGEVVLVSSHPGETIFQMKVARESPMRDQLDVSEDGINNQVIPDENGRT